MEELQREFKLLAAACKMAYDNFLDAGFDNANAMLLTSEYMRYALDGIPESSDFSEEDYS